MVAKKKGRGEPVHASIKKRLGYDESLSDDEVYSDWKERLSRVCKPCWEIKYCPYGPLVEQLPLLPPLRSNLEQQNEGFREAIKTNTIGEVEVLDDNGRARYEEWLDDDQILLHQAVYEIQGRRRFEELAKIEGEENQIEAWIGGDLPPLHVYRTPYNALDQKDVLEKDFPPEEWQEIVRTADAIRAKYKEALSKGEIDNRRTLEPTRRAWFNKRIKEFQPDQYPDSIPEIFEEAVCTVFGHVCPVFFAAEEITETEEQRRMGRRRLGFETMMRIVRRDDYRCQHCRKKLQDNEVEFDHIIPVAKGGSSEEHNIRLTCFDCNRDKSDDYTP